MKANEKKRIKKNAVVSLIKVSLFLFLFVFGCYVFLTTAPGEKIIKDFLLNELINALDANVAIQQLETNLFSRIKLHQLEISQNQQNNILPLLTLKTVQINYSLFDLINHKIRLKKIGIDSLLINVSRDSKGHFSFLSDDAYKSEPADTSRSPFSLIVEKLDLKNSAVFYSDKFLNLDASLFNVHIKTNLKPQNDFQLKVTADSMNAKYKTVPLSAQSISMVGTWNPTHWQIDSLQFLLSELQLFAYGSGNQTSFDSAHINLAGPLDKISAIYQPWIPEILLPIEGELHLQFKATGDLEEPRIDVLLLMSDLTAGYFGLQQAELSGTWCEHAVELTSFQAQLFDGNIFSDGKIVLDSSGFNNLQFNLHNINLADLWRAIYHSQSEINGLVSGHLWAEGKGSQLANWQIQADLSIINIRYENKSLSAINTKFTLKDGFATFNFAQATSEIFLNTTFFDHSLSGNFTGKIEDLSYLTELLNVEEVRGQLQFSGNISGSQEKPRIEADVFGSHLKYQNFPLDSMAAKIHFCNNILFIEQLTGNGNLAVIDSAQAPFHLTGLSGGFNYFAEASGPIDNLLAHVEMELNSPAFESLVFDKGIVQASLQNQIIHLDYFNLIRDSLLANIQADLSLSALKGKADFNLYKLATNQDKIFSLKKPIAANDETLCSVGQISNRFDFSDKRNIDISTSAENVSLQELGRLTSAALKFGGTANFNSHFQGSFDEPEIDLQIYINRPSFASTIFDSVVSNIQFHRSKLIVKNIDLHLKNFHSHANALVEMTKEKDGSYRLSSENKTQGTLISNRFDISSFNSLLLQQNQIYGSAELVVDWDGTIETPHLFGQILLSDGQLNDAQKKPLLQNMQANIFLKDSVVQIQEIKTDFQNMPIKLYGALTEEQKHRINLDLRVEVANQNSIDLKGLLTRDSIWVESKIKDLNLSLMQPFVTVSKQLSGRLNSTTLISGKPLNPQLNGNLEIRGLQAQLPVINANLSQGVVKINFDKQRILVDSVFVASNGGTIFLTGKLNHFLGKIDDINLQAKINKIRINRPKEFTLDIKSSTINYKEVDNYNILDGDILLGESKFIYNIRPQMFINFAKSVERPRPEQAEIFKKTKFNIRLRESEQIWVDNNLARVRLHPELSLIGTPANPFVGGRLNIEEGYVLYLDRKFKISKGVIDFIDPNKMNPIINIEARAILKSYQTLVGTEYEIVLSINGALDQAELKLVSEPALEKADIISLLTIGATRQQLTSTSVEGKDPTTTRILLERAKSLSSERISGYAERKLGNVLGLEKITIEGNLLNFGKTWGPQLMASKKLSDRVNLIYTTTVGYMNEQNIRLGYRLTKKFSIEGQTDQRGRSGIDIKYKLKTK